MQWPFHFPHRLEREGFGRVSMLTCDGAVGGKRVAGIVGKDDKEKKAFALRVDVKMSDA